MYLESLTIKNYRKFGEKNNIIKFVHATPLSASNLKETPSESKTKGNNKEPLTEDDTGSQIAQSSTLIIGKNNTGKTTITEALKFLTSSNTQNLKSSDFNVSYLKDVIKKYLAFYQDTTTPQDEKIKPTPPEIEFKITAKINNNKPDNYITHIAPFIPISDRLNEDITIDIVICYKVKNAEKFNDSFLTKLKTITSAPEENKAKINLEYQQFEELCNLIDNKATEFAGTYYNKKGAEVTNFSLRDFINIQNIAANRDMKDRVLSRKFKEIFLLQAVSLNLDETLKPQVDTINEKLTGNIEKIQEKAKDILFAMEDKKHVDLLLQGNVQTDALLKDMIRYIFLDGDDFIPENQFGLGYVNLICIVADIIHYIDSYEVDSHQSRINLFLIEEPEIFMHPQMQEFFITRIDNAVATALSLSESKPELQCQIIITTHSSHIVNSKIHSSNSFNNINYLSHSGKYAKSIPLCDKIIKKEMTSSKKKENEQEKEAKNNFVFLKKHIKYKASELFFADAVIFVEGATEETYLQHYIAQNDVLKKHYISVFRIDGSHAKVYLPLIKLLQIPCLIITDLDIKRETFEKGQATKEDIASGKTNEYKQLGDLTDQKTANETLKSFFNDEIGNLPYANYYEDENLYVVFQKDKINDYYATSLEEAIILTNSDNVLLQETLKELKPNIYEKIIGCSTSPSTQLQAHSFELYEKLRNDKTKFMGTFLYKILTNEATELPKLPQYIEDGFKWIGDKLGLINGGGKNAK